MVKSTPIYYLSVINNNAINNRRKYMFHIGYLCDDNSILINQNKNIIESIKEIH